MNKVSIDCTIINALNLKKILLNTFLIIKKIICNKIEDFIPYNDAYIQA